MKKNFLGTAISIDMSTVPWTFYYGPDTGTITTPGETITSTATTALTASSQTVNMIVIAGALILLLAIGNKGGRS